MLLDGFNEDGTAIYLNHNHNVFVARLRALWKLSSLVSEDGVMDVVDLGVHVLHLATLELVCVNKFERCGFGFVGTDILVGLIERAFGHLCCFRIIFLDILDGEQWPDDEVTGLNGFEPHGFDRIAADCMNPLDGLFHGG
jgi:hypothetical protein